MNMQTNRIGRWSVLMAVALLFGGWITVVQTVGIYLPVSIPMTATLAATQAILATLVVYVLYFEPAPPNA
jgi:hypothetical protein